MGEIQSVLRVRGIESQITLAVQGKMLRKGVKCFSSWLFQDENIEDVESINLKSEIQQWLGCSINTDVFLDCPFACVPAEQVKSNSNISSSPLAKFKEKLQLYKNPSFLLGYASRKLISDKFVICLTEEAQNQMMRRNRDIKMRINELVKSRLERKARAWKSLGSDRDLEFTLVKTSRPYYQIEVSLPVKIVGRERKLSDRNVDDVRDGYVNIIPKYEVFENIEMLLVSKAVQTNLESRESAVQTYPGYPINKWTQYNYKCCSDELKSDYLIDKNKRKIEVNERADLSNEIVNEMKKVIKSESDEEGKVSEKIFHFDMFLKEQLDETLDMISYNSVINIMSDDILNLTFGQFEKLNIENVSIYKEQSSLFYLPFSGKKLISSISWNFHSGDSVAISYNERRKKKKSKEQQLKRSSMMISGNYLNEADNTTDIFNENNWKIDYSEVLHNSDRENRERNDGGSDFELVLHLENSVFIWSLSSSLSPEIVLTSKEVITIVSFCPYKSHILIGGSFNGQILIWDLKESSLSSDKIVKDIKIIQPIVISDEAESLGLPIRKIEWLPSWYKIDRDGSVKESYGKNLQFVTLSDDGALAIWDLSWEVNFRISFKRRKTDIVDIFDLRKLDGLLKPIHRIVIKDCEESWKSTMFCFCLNFSENENYSIGKIDSRVKESLRRFLVGTVEGEVISCSWGDYDSEDVVPVQKCTVLGKSSVHDGAVLQMSRCPFLKDLVLTIGGKIFALWRNDFLDSPLIWRKSRCHYTSSCWSVRAGIFLLSNSDGIIEIWDLTKKTGEAVFSQQISSKSLMGLYPFFSANIIGISDSQGALRIFTEPKEFKDESLKRIELLEEFVWRDIKRKRDFSIWQLNFFKINQEIVEKVEKYEDAEEARRKREKDSVKFQMDKEEKSAKLEADSDIKRVDKLKSVVWKERDLKRMEIDLRRMERILLARRGFLPDQLEESRLPLVIERKERDEKMKRAKEEVGMREKYFWNFVSVELPEVEIVNRAEFNEEVVSTDVKINKVEENFDEEFEKIRKEAQGRIKDFDNVRKFDWSFIMKRNQNKYL